MKASVPKLRTALSPILSIIVLLTAFISASPVYAVSGYLADFNSLYPGSTSANNASCQLCHGSSTQNLNPYGAAICVQGGGITARLQAVEAANSDADPTGSNNITEINASTQPGWTPGNVNALFNRGNCSAIGTTEAPPAFIAGDLDPAAGNQPPVADANGPYTGTVGVAVTFDGTASNDPDGTIVSYAWDFGDGTIGTGATPTHTYLVDGTFDVTLTVTDDAGDTGMDATTAAIALGNQPPVADPNGPYTGTVGVAVTFDGTASNDPDGTIASYSWDFGDGNVGNGPTPTHTYAAANTYNVTLMVTDDAGATDSAGTTADIAAQPVNQPPVADANGPYSGEVGVAVTFDGTASSDPDGTIVSYAWEFGDGNTGTGPTPTHVYSANGNYPVTLTVTDDAGDTGTDTSTASIGAVNQPPVADPNGPYSGTAGVPVTFDGTGSSDADGTIVSYAWDFGDGASGSGPTPTHTYSANVDIPSQVTSSRLK
ncbi:MAG: PKD domain-containing protein [Pseudomonadota bacterium]|nr:MAG: PKD domain-containing protein [Pseudomonadota bacterium]